MYHHDWYVLLPILWPIAHGQSSGRANCLTLSTAAALVGNFLIIFTTIHAQDFKDIVGDKIQGRKTLPILVPTLSRLSMPCLLLSWSWAVHNMCALSGISSVVLFVTSTIVGGRFLFLRSVYDDQMSYLLYNVVFFFHAPDIDMSLILSLRSGSVWFNSIFSRIEVRRCSILSCSALLIEGRERCYAVAPNWFEFANNSNTFVQICHPSKMHIDSGTFSFNMIRMIP